MKIGQLAKAAGTQAETIRYYERLGLLPSPTRTAGNYREYDQSQIDRLAFIRHCRCLDMTLDEIRVLLQVKDAPTENCGEADRLLDVHIGHVASRIRELKALEMQLRDLRQQCTQDHIARDCGILHGIEHAARTHDHTPRRGDDEVHVHGVHKEVGPQGIGRRSR